ncbi:MAG: hypothetical protein ACREMS_02905 [Gemmatimonadaceae bacterium]
MTAGSVFGFWRASVLVWVASICPRVNYQPESYQRESYQRESYQRERYQLERYQLERYQLELPAASPELPAFSCRHI